MLLAHRVPATLCSCIRRRSLSSPQLARGITSLARRSQSRMNPLEPPAVLALANLVHSTGAQWAPIRAMPFHGTAGRRADSTPLSAGTSGLAVDVRAAVELGTSVWRQTATHLLETSRSGGGDGDDGGLTVGEKLDPDGGDGQNGGRDAFDTAIAALCRILCEAGDLSSSPPASKIREENESVDAAPFCGGGILRRSSSSQSGGAMRLAALRVLLHCCRASPDVAHAIVAFDRGAAVQAVLDRLSLPARAQDDHEVRVIEEARGEGGGALTISFRYTYEYLLMNSQVGEWQMESRNWRWYHQLYLVAVSC